MWIIGNELRHASYDATNLSKGREWVGKDYCVKIRKFAHGAVEVCCHHVDAITQKGRAESAMLGGLVKRKRVMVPDAPPKSEEERELDSRARAVRRARQKVRWLVKSIGADHLLTLTYRTVAGAPMNDVERLKADWDRFRRLVKVGLPACGTWRAHPGIEDWPFVAVREHHENGSYHLHVAVRGRQDINFIRRAWFVAIGGNQDDRGENTRGNIDVRGPAKRWGKQTSDWRCDKLAGYMTKYLHKCFDDPGEMKFAKRYWAGRTIPKPDVKTVWIGSAGGVYEAVLQVHAMFRAECNAKRTKVWLSDGYDCIWMSG